MKDNKIFMKISKKWKDKNNIWNNSNSFQKTNKIPNKLKIKNSKIKIIKMK